MQDLLLLAIMVAFFGLCLLFVRACAAIIGDEEEMDRTVADAPGFPSERAA